MSTSDAQDPVLAGAGPVSLHLDERHRSATITLQRPGLPDDAPDEWQARGLNTYETSTTYRDIDDVVITGWTHTPLTRWTITAHRDSDRITVSLSGDGQHITFSADSDVRTARKGLLTGSI